MKHSLTAALALAALAGLGSTTLPADAEAELRRQQPNSFKSTPQTKPPKLTCHTGFAKTTAQYFPPNQHNGFAKKLVCETPVMNCGKANHPGLEFSAEGGWVGQHSGPNSFKLRYQCEFLPGGSKAMLAKNQPGSLAPKPFVLKCATGFKTSKKENYPSGMYDGHPKRLECVTPLIKCPKPPAALGLAPENGYTFVTYGNKEGTFKLSYDCSYRPL